MARPVTLDYVAIKKEIESKGVHVNDINRNSGRLVIYFNCTNCGAPYNVKYSNWQKGDNPEFYCKKCQAIRGPKMTRIKDYFASKNVDITLVEMDPPHHKHWVIHFNCSKCKSPYTILDDYVGKNNLELLCSHCRPNTTVPTQKSLEKEFKDRGSELLSTYVNNNTPVEFKCTRCGKSGFISIKHFHAKSINPDLLCDECRELPDTEKDLKELLEAKGSELLEPYTTAKTPVLIKCTKCEKPFKFSFAHYRNSGNNQNLWCPECRYLDLNGPNLGKSQGDRLNPWHTWVKEFFTIPKASWGDYEAHHIIRVVADGDYSTSITNGYPLKKELHTVEKKFYHYSDGVYQSNWTGMEKLPYHNYSGFEFLDFNSKFVMEVLSPEKSMEMQYLVKRKREFAQQGKFYFPVFYQEMFDIEHRKIIYSMIRARLSRMFPDVYKYTGANFRKFYARKMECFEPDFAMANLFQMKSHVQSSVRAQVYVGLRNPVSGTIEAIMTFGTPRTKSGTQWELLRFCTTPDTVIVGGASKMFKYFVDKYHPESIVSFCDCRFASNDPAETVYPKLGFEFAGVSKPNYKYRSPSGEFYSRWDFQKHKLAEKLDVFDPALTEFENMEMNGYVRLVDCGNFKFVWKRKEQ